MQTTPWIFFFFKVYKDSSLPYKAQQLPSQVRLGFKPNYEPQNQERRWRSLKKGVFIDLWGNRLLQIRFFKCVIIPATAFPSTMTFPQVLIHWAQNTFAELQNTFFTCQLVGEPVLHPHLTTCFLRPLGITGVKLCERKRPGRWGKPSDRNVWVGQREEREIWVKEASPGKQSKQKFGNNIQESSDQSQLPTGSLLTHEWACLCSPATLIPCLEASQGQLCPWPECAGDFTV